MGAQVWTCQDSFITNWLFAKSCPFQLYTFQAWHEQFAMITLPDLPLEFHCNLWNNLSLISGRAKIKASYSFLSVNVNFADWIASLWCVHGILSTVVCQQIKLVPTMCRAHLFENTQKLLVEGVLHLYLIATNICWKTEAKAAGKESSQADEPCTAPNPNKWCVKNKKKNEWKKVLIMCLFFLSTKTTY